MALIKNAQNSTLTKHTMKLVSNTPLRKKEIYNCELQKHPIMLFLYKPLSHAIKIDFNLLMGTLVVNHIYNKYIGYT